MAELAKITDREPVHVEVCEGVMLQVIAGKSHQYVQASTCVQALSGGYLPHNRVDGVNKCVNIYDVRLEDTSPQCGMNWPPDLDAVYNYLGVRHLRCMLLP